MYQIIKRYHYYAGTLGAPDNHYLTEGDLDEQSLYYDDIVEYETRDEAQAVIDGLSESIYYLAHGEADRPTYQIVKDYDCGLEDCIKHDLSDGEWDSIPESEAPYNIFEEANVEYEQSLSDDYDIYSSVDVDYKVTYAVCKLQLQHKGVDSLEWDHPTYYRRR